MSLIIEARRSQYPCRVQGCHYCQDHVTSEHLCGSCQNFGHGQHECGNNSQIDNLYERSTFVLPYAVQQSNRRICYESLPADRQCQHPLCANKETHSTGSHHSKHQMNQVVWDLERRFESIQRQAHEQLMNRPGYYVKPWIGMGNYDLYRNVNGSIEKLQHPQTEDNFIRNLKELHFKYD